MKRPLLRAYDKRLGDRLAKIRKRKNVMRLHMKALRQAMEPKKEGFMQAMIRTGVLVRVS